MNKPRNTKPSGYREKHWISVCLAMLLAAVCSCSFDADQEELSVARSISFEASGDAAAGWDDAITKVVVTDREHIANFTVNATTAGGVFNFMNNTNVVRGVGADANRWLYSPIKYYPTDGSTVNFFAYSPAGSANVKAVASSSNSAFITYRVPLNDPTRSAESIQEDFLIAADLGRSEGSVAFTFCHALAHIRFEATNNMGADLVITAIQLLFLDREGKVTLPFNYGGMANWTDNYDYNSIYQASIPAQGILLHSSVEPQLITSANEGLLILPQNLKVRQVDGSGGTETTTTGTFTYPPDAGSGMGQFSYIAITYYATSDEVVYTKYIPLNIIFENKSYLFQFSIGDIAR